MNRPMKKTNPLQRTGAKVALTEREQDRAGDRTRTGDVQLGKQLNAHHKNPHSQAKSLCCNAQRRVPQLVSCGAFSSMWPKLAHRATRATHARKMRCTIARAPPRNLTRGGDDNT